MRPRAHAANAVFRGGDQLARVSFFLEEGFSGEGENGVLPRAVFSMYLLFLDRSSLVPSRRIFLVLAPLAMRIGAAGCARASAVALSMSSPSRRPMVTIRRPLWPLTDKFVVRLGGLRSPRTRLMVSYEERAGLRIYETAAGRVSG